MLIVQRKGIIGFNLLIIQGNRYPCTIKEVRKETKLEYKKETNLASRTSSRQTASLITQNLLEKARNKLLKMCSKQAVKQEKS